MMRERRTVTDKHYGAVEITAYPEDGAFFGLTDSGTLVYALMLAGGEPELEDGLAEPDYSIIDAAVTTRDGEILAELRGEPLRDFDEIAGELESEDVYQELLGARGVTKLCAYCGAEVLVLMEERPVCFEDAHKHLNGPAQ